MPIPLINAIALAALLPLAAAAQSGVPGGHFIENWDLNGDGQITQAEATEKRDDLFYMFDQNEDGSLDHTEYTLFDETREADMQANAGGFQRGPMAVVNQGLTREFNDANGDGQVSREEFLARVPEWFALIDHTGDNIISSHDFGANRG